MTKMPHILHTTSKAYMTYKSYMLLALFVLLPVLPAGAQIVIGGAVYGGGNEGEVGGSTNVTIHEGDIKQVYGGARMADIKGRTYVNIDARKSADQENDPAYVVIDYLYGGNDISGSIGTDPDKKTVPEDIAADVDKDGNSYYTANNKITTQEGENVVTSEVSFGSYIRFAPLKEGGTVQRYGADGTTRLDDRLVYIGQTFCAGNGNYIYADPIDNGDGTFTHKIFAKEGDTEPIASKVTNSRDEGYTKPEMNNSYMQILGGSMVYAFGGGNLATVKGNTVIVVDNPSKVVNGVKDARNPNADSSGELLTEERITVGMALNSITTYATSDAFQIGSFFGGNNKAEMAIQPHWDLRDGLIRNLYSGGNEGDITYEKGLLLNIEATSTIKADNVYGGCRKADVRPKDASGNDVNADQIKLGVGFEGYKFPVGYSARVRVAGGDINNVYGGNDISGDVYGGSAVNIEKSIRGDVYGGGNGSYAYTDNPALKDDPTWGDFYYDVNKILTPSSGSYTTGFSGLQSAEALAMFRPNAERTLIRVAGHAENDKTIIGGAIYIGGNSATLWNTRLPDAQATGELKIGSYVIADSAFIGNNGVNMIDATSDRILKRYAGTVKLTGQTSGTDYDFSQMDLTDAAQFSKYMDGCTMSVHPSITFDDEVNGDPATYIDYSTYIGSLFCGGNVASVTAEGTTTLNFNRDIIIFNKLVGGCNNAYVAKTDYNAVYEGGYIGSEAERTSGYKDGDKIKDRIVLNLAGLKIQPKRWIDPTNKSEGLEWNTFDYTTGGNVNAMPIAANTLINPTTNAEDFHRRFRGGNVYGGCNISGHILGNVIINLKADLIDKDIIFDKVEVTQTTSEGTDKLYGNMEYKVLERNSGVILDEQGMDPLGMALNVFGGGYGKDSEVWGSTTVNLERGYTFQIFGGGEKGAIGKKVVNGDGTPQKDKYGRYIYAYDPNYSTYVNLKGSKAGVADDGTKDEDMAETEFIYGGSFEAPIAGDTHVYLDNGRIFNSFAGSCNADIEGHTETYVGLNGYPYIIDHIYGGNDLGGIIKGQTDFSGRIREDIRANVYNNGENSTTTNAGAYIEYVKGHIENIFGGCYGVYDYKDRKYSAYTDANGENIQVEETASQEGSYFTKPRLGNAFVHFKPAAGVLNPTNGVARIFGAGEGQSLVIDRDVMQERSYILVDAPENVTTFQNMEVFGAGAFSGLGMEKAAATATAYPDSVSAVIDLFSGRIKNAYGGSYEEGITRRTVVNVPTGSAIKVERVFGGAYGITNALPCDVIESNVNWNSSNALITLEVTDAEGNSDVGKSGGIYGGNNNARRTLFTNVNVNAAVTLPSGYQGYVFGGGFGVDTWAQHTTVNLNDGARIYKGYGGGSAGRVLNRASLPKWVEKVTAEYTTAHAAWESADPATRGNEPVASIDLTLGGDYTEDYLYSDASGLYRYGQLAEDIEDGIVRDRGMGKEKYETNLHVFKGASVSGYLYGGGFGGNAIVSGDSYVDVLGGIVSRDVYASGESGPVMDAYGVGQESESNPNGFRACANAYIKSGMVRNVYGGGWRGNVGYHEGQTLAISDADVVGLSNVVVGTLTGTGFYDGIPAITRNVYGGGEGGSIYGTANVNVNNGYIGYRYTSTLPGTFTPSAEDAGISAGYYDTSGNFNAVTVSAKSPISTQIDADPSVPGYYIEELGDWKNNEWIADYIDESGNVFGGGYVAHSYTDKTEVNVYNGTVRGSLYGGGEIGPIGRGTITFKTGTAPFVNHEVWIYVPGETHVYLYGGKVLRDVFGGGRGFDNWGGDGTAYYGTEEVSNMDLKTKGYVFGTTDVRIRGGEVGTEAGIGKGYGNVFGGGNIGYVYSGIGTKNSSDGYYYASGALTEDCRVVVEPYAKVLSAYDSYQAGDYVPTDVLDGYSYDSGPWSNLDQTGITIHNAIFAGGNVSSGSDQIYANTSTVFGNATASVTDLFEKDFITIGDDGIGGLYGDGNLTFVDGYRELNITNYGTDYNHLNKELTWDQYQLLNKRQRAYYELKYKANSTHTYDGYYTAKETHSYGDTTYKKGQKITASEYASLTAEEQANWTAGRSIHYDVNDQITETEYDLMDATEQANWTLHGFATLFYGRMMNTIQRADFCGVFGSRIALRGARDRVPSLVDYTDYTINRVKELSLNQNRSNGNYFGIYNVVNYLGALTSDVDFKNAVRESHNSKTPGDGVTSYYDWKVNNLNSRSRNDGESANIVSLASGVWLEILDESTETASEKVYGPITGVVELDLINVATGEGGGYVYAKNEHRVLASKSETGQTTLAGANNKAISYKQFTYSGEATDMETSGNFVNYLKRIVDDCYPTNGDKTAPGHYWFIRGDYYVYDQYISAYTGSAQAYAETVSIPLSITAESQGKLRLVSVQPNLYAYWDDNTLLPKYQSSTEDNAIIVGGVTYHKNDPISYWTWSHLSDAERELFIPDETYVCTNTATVNGTTYTAGDVFLTKPADIYVCMQAYEDGSNAHAAGEVISKEAYNALDEITQSRYAAVFNRSNTVTNEDGFVLTFDWDNPDVWNDYYHSQSGDGTVRSSAYTTMPDGYVTSPSFKCTTSGIYGQSKHSLGDIIDETTYNYESAFTDANLSAVGLSAPEGQAKFAAAYVVKDNCTFTDNGTNYNYVKGACITAEQYNNLSAANKAYFEEGKLCTETYSRNDDEHYLFGQVIPVSLYNTLVSEKPEVANNFSNAYLCYEAGLWGGQIYKSGESYKALDYSNLSSTERANFTYNYDALNLLIDSTYPAYEDDYYEKVYDGLSKDSSEEPTLYAKQQSIDYTATYDGTNMTEDNKLSKQVTVTRGGSQVTTDKLENGDVLTNTVYENDLINEQANYATIVVQGNSIQDVYYVANTSFQIGDKSFLPGNVLTTTEYNDLTNKSNVTQVTRDQLAAVTTLPTGDNIQQYYFCTKDYTPSAGGSSVAKGTIINTETYSNLTNEHKDFIIDGKIPTETSTLYVAREASIDDLRKDKIITVTYWYDYLESDETGSNYETIREKHVVNVHVHFESGVPSIGPLLPPNTILPGNYLSLNQPTVTKGAYEILGGGWEIFSNETEAVTHQNGAEYTNYGTPLYWYQDDYWVAYYAKTYLGKTYSNPVQVSVANYHDIDRVMGDKDNHLHIDHPTLDGVNRRYAKIYIDGNDATYNTGKSKLDLLKDLYDLSLHNETDPETGNPVKVTSGTFKDGTAMTEHTSLNSRVSGGDKLDFILRGDVSPKVYTDWTSIGDDTKCFEGTLHGDGYTVGGLNNALFGTLCGNVYNLGVTGTFTTAGVALKGSGYAENCWVMNTQGTEAAPTTMQSGQNPIIGDPTRSDGTQIVNCYYPTTNNYTGTTTHGTAVQRPLRAFYNGEVAYDLNGFYLHKRYNDNATGLTQPMTYNYWDSKNLTGNKMTKTEGKYEAETNDYVEQRYGNIDFTFAAGTIPESDDVRFDSNTEKFYPIWPDDYLFFGQTLSYGYVDARPHQDQPSSINKEGGRLPSATSSIINNRVYRAPGYFRSKEMSVAHFNDKAVFAQTKRGDATAEAYKYMTAIDFTGDSDVTNAYKSGRDNTTAVYQHVAEGKGAFYPPLLDNDGLESLLNADLTKNWLVYTPKATATATDADSKTNSVVTTYLADAQYSETNADYRTVNEQDNSIIHGHAVVLDGGYKSVTDHFLVDKQDFNAPIAYTMGSGKRMWYQRKPTEDYEFVDTLKGWQGISIPFAAEVVTTQQKGELTHFYTGSATGHEYWLREFKGNLQQAKDADGNIIADTYTAEFNYPAAGTNGSKNYQNTFLWDFYYSELDQRDRNSDLYQEYYKTGHPFSNYGYSTAGTPYIIGLPGQTYYEFDLSGKFLPAHTANDDRFKDSDKRMSRQVITFASFPGNEIAVSDDEMTASATANTHDECIFTPNYLGKPMQDGYYQLNSEGSAYEAVEASSGVYPDAVPFRPYFTKATKPGSGVKGARRIAFAQNLSELGHGEAEPGQGDATGEGLLVSAKSKRIIVTSAYSSEVQVTIVNTAGAVIGSFSLQPGQTEETTVASGVYLVNKIKIAVK